MENNKVFRVNNCCQLLSFWCLSPVTLLMSWLFPPCRKSSCHSSIIQSHFSFAFSFLTNFLDAVQVRLYFYKHQCYWNFPGLRNLFFQSYYHMGRIKYAEISCWEEIDDNNIGRWWGNEKSAWVAREAPVWVMIELMTWPVCFICVPSLASVQVDAFDGWVHRLTLIGIFPRMFYIVVVHRGILKLIKYLGHSTEKGLRFMSFSRSE